MNIPPNINQLNPKEIIMNIDHQNSKSTKNIISFIPYCLNWIDLHNKLFNTNIHLIQSPYFTFKINDIVAYTFDDTIAHIKGYYDDPISNSYCAILGGLEKGQLLSMTITNLRKANGKEKLLFNRFADIEGNPIQSRLELLIN